jgi:hypothetical protein
MAVRKCEAGGLVMIAGGVIHNLRGREIRVTVHLGNEVAVIDAVLTFIQNDKRHGRPGPEHLT